MSSTVRSRPALLNYQLSVLFEVVFEVYICCFELPVESIAAKSAGFRVRARGRSERTRPVLSPDGAFAHTRTATPAPSVSDEGPNSCHTPDATLQNLYREIQSRGSREAHTRPPSPIPRSGDSRGALLLAAGRSSKPPALLVAAAFPARRPGAGLRRHLAAATLPRACARRPLCAGPAYARTFGCLHVCTSARLHVCTSVCPCVRMSVSMSVCLRVCMQVCRYDICKYA